MIIFVEGSQSVGKSTLIKSCKYQQDRFPFNQYMNMFEIRDIGSFQIAKDFGILFGLQYTKDNIVLDRGPLSTIFYSLKEKRYGKKTPQIVKDFIDEISKFQNCRYVVIKKINDFGEQKRNKNDGFDYLDDDRDLEKDKLWQQIIEVGINAGLNIITFENDFSLPLEKNVNNFNKILERIIK